jgi:hypothetical protein
LKIAGVILTSAPPQWVTTLGTGVTVIGPEQVAPGHGSPGAALTGVLAALSSKDRTTFCDYMFVVSAARCTGPSGQGSRDRLPYGVSVKIGYAAVSGTRALVGFTGKICWPGATRECTANTNPAAVFSAGNTFAALWEQTLHLNSNISSYRLLRAPRWAGNGPPAPAQR